MPAQKNAVSPEVYQLKVTLLGTSPPIWRRLLVSADVTLAQLHDVLQAAMGWEDGHMHEFSAGQRRFGRPDPEDRFMGLPSVENERTLPLSGILARVGYKVIPLCAIRSALAVSSHVRRKTVVVSPATTILSRPSAIPTTNATKSCWTGSAILIPKHSRLTTRTEG